MKIATVPPDALLQDAIRALADHGPLESDALADLLGLDPWGMDYDELEDELFALDRIVELVDGSFADAPALLMNRTFTHRLSEDEAASERIDLIPDFGAFSELSDEGLPLALGGRLPVIVDRLEDDAYRERLYGHPGWLGGARAGDLVGLTLTEDGFTVEARVAVSPPGAEQPDALAAALRTATQDRLERIDDGWAEAPSEHGPARVLASAVLYDSFGLQPGSWPSTLPSLTELSQRAGVFLGGSYLFLEDPGEPAHEMSIGDTLTGIRFGLDDESLEAFRHVRRLHERGREELTGTELAAAGEALAQPRVARAFAASTAADEHAGRLAERIAQQSSGDAAAGAWWVAARAAEVAGATREADATLRRAHQAGADHPLVLQDLAWYAEERGDASTALSLLRRAGLSEEHQELQRLRSLLRPFAEAGRNDPCPCGSGRKYKACCGQRPGGSLARRAPWLVEKLWTFLMRAGQREVAERFAELLDPNEDDDSLHPLAFDLAMFDGGVLRAYVEQRGALLPEDERQLARSWVESQRAVYRVVRWHDGQATLQPIDGGEAVTASVAGGATEDVVGSYVLARVVHDSTEPMLFWAPAMIGATRRPDLEDLVAEGDPDALARAFSPGVRLVNAEGDPSVMCTTVYAVDDEEAAVGALRGLGLREDAHGQFSEWITIDGKPWQRGQVRVGLAHVRLDTNGEARMDELRDRVECVLSDAALLFDSRLPPEVGMDDYQRFFIPRAPIEHSAADRAAMAEFLAEAEREWCDESIAALGGLTPRQAAANPEARGGLDALLDSFDVPRPGGFDAGRLRALLGLDA